MENLVDAYVLSFIILTVFSAALYAFYSIKRRQPANIAPVLASIITIVLLYRIIGSPGANYYNVLALDLCIGSIASILAVFYVSKKWVFIAFLLLLAAGIAVYSATYPSNSYFAGIIGIGIIYGLMYREFALSPRRSQTRMQQQNRKKEVSRDIIQLMLGAILFVVVYSASSYNSILIITGLILFGLLANNVIANMKSKSFDLERKGVEYGRGAAYLAAGTALIIGFVHPTMNLLFGLSVLFFADSAATITGVALRHGAKLPYNRNKSLPGTLAFFAVAAVAGYIAIGYYGILFAAVLAFIESMDTVIDDNVRIGVAFSVLNALLIF